MFVKLAKQSLLTSGGTLAAIFYSILGANSLELHS